MVTKEAKIYIAGHRGMVGSAVWRALTKQRVYEFVRQNQYRTRFKKSTGCC